MVLRTKVEIKQIADADALSQTARKEIFAAEELRDLIRSNRAELIKVAPRETAILLSTLRKSLQNCTRQLLHARALREDVVKTVGRREEGEQIIENALAALAVVALAEEERKQKAKENREEQLNGRSSS